MSNWYVSREAVKAAGKIYGSERHFILDPLIAAKSRTIERITRRFFIPKTETRIYPWPPLQRSRLYRLWLDQDLLSITTLKTKAEDSSPTTIASSDYFTEPNNKLPYTRIEIDLSSTAAFESGDSWQRSIEVVGSWGYSNNTKSTGTVSSGLASSTTATSMVCSDASLIDVGDTLLIESEQIFVSDRDFAALGSILVNDASVAAQQNDNTITLDTSHGVIAGEVVRLDSELMYVLSVSGNDITVIRSYDGSVLASHADDVAVHINRTLTIERALNGTTGATHANATAISKYVPQEDITWLVLAEVVAGWAQALAAFGRTVGAGEAASEWEGKEMATMRKTTLGYFTRMRSGAV